MPTLALVIGGLVLVTLLLIGTLARMFRKVGPNQALIVYGFGGTQIVQGGGRIILPIVQSYRELSLELMSFDVAPQQDLYTNQGVAVTVEAVAQIKIKSDPHSIRTAAEQLLTKPPAEREGLIRLVMEGHLRGIIGQLTVEQIVKEPEMVADRMRANVAEDLAKMGLEVVSFTIREVRDKNEYIANMGKPDIARVKKVANVAAAEAERDTSIRQAETMREASVAQAAADQETVIARSASQARQAEAQRDLNLKRAEYDATVKKQQAAADKAYDIQANIEQQRVIAEQVGVQRVEREQQIRVQEAEIERRQRELEATVLKAAEAERRRIELLAEAQRQRTALEAIGRADAVRAEGQAEADVIRLRGQSEAEVIKAKGASEAEAMQLKADAYKGYNEAAIIDRIVANLPELVKGMSAPLSNVDRITVVSTGDGANGTGMSQITTDLARMVATAPAMVEGLTGLKMSDLLERVPGLREEVRAIEHNGSTNGTNARV
ncbi:MAG: SPFH domain-containing protein [Chloroflexota bacterium]|nr:SPFH domain-containing protein [Chloroflexota bacterium]